MMKLLRLPGKLWRQAALAFVLLAAAGGALAQGARNDGIVFSAQGTPAAGAIVAVCTQPANTSTTPCSPLAILYTDPTLTVTAPNPLTSDGLGNYHFYAAPGRYTLQFYGGPIATPYIQKDVMLPNDPATPTFTSVTTSGTISGLTLNLGGNLSVGGSANVVGSFTTGSFNPSNMAVSGSLTYLGGKVPQAEPLGGQSGDAICHVSPNTGNDANDGLSEGLAKADVTACWQAMPQFDILTNAPAGGTIYVTSGAAVGNPLGANVGLQIAGANDPNTLLASNGHNTLPFVIASLVRSSNVVTATLTVPPPAYYVTNAVIAVSDAQDTIGSGMGSGDASFNGTFTLTNVSGDTMTWNQTGANSTVTAGGIILPGGWLYSGDYSIVCSAGRTTTANGHVPKCLANWGDSTHPSVHISGSANAILFQQLVLNGGQIAAQIGVDTNGSRNGTGGTTSVTFQSSDLVPAQCAGCGPGVDIGSNSFDLRFFDYAIAGNPSATGGPLSDPYQAVVINPGSGSGSGLIYFTHGNTNGGAIKDYTSSTGSSLYVDGLSVEDDTEAGVWVPAPQSASTIVNVKNVEISDCNTAHGVHCYSVRVDYNAGGSANTDAVVVERVAAPLSGPMVCLTACNTANYNTQVVSNLRAGQAGIIGGGSQLQGSAPARLEGTQVEAGRRNFAPAAARFTPLAQLGGGSSTLPANWAFFQGTGTVTTGIAAPDGTTGAGRITRSTGSIVQVNACCVIVTPVVGQWYIAGVWARSNTANGFAGGSPANLEFSGDANDKWQSSGNSQAQINQYIEGDGEWRWYYTAQKVSATDGSGVNLYFLLQADATHTIDFYAPIVMQIPAGAISDNEALEYAINMATYSGTAAAGDISMLPTQRFRMSVPGSNFQYLWQGAPTADRTITLPDASFTVAQTAQLPLSATSGSIGGSAVGAGACASGTVSVTGATTSMAVKATPAADPGTSFIPWAFVSSANTVTVRVCNFTSTSATPTSTTYNIRVIQ
jgi:hypothetical protein